MNKLSKVILVIILLVVVVFIFIMFNTNSQEVAKYFEKEPISSITSIVNNQYDINKKLNTISSDNNYTINNPYIELNPYKISPLSAVVIFNTNSEKEIELYINGKKETKMELSKKHVIPVYGLKEDFDNKIELKMDDKSYEYIENDLINLIENDSKKTS